MHHLLALCFVSAPDFLVSLSLCLLLYMWMIKGAITAATPAKNDHKPLIGVIYELMKRLRF